VVYTIVGMCVFGYEHDKFSLWQVVIGMILGAGALIGSWGTLLINPGVCKKVPYEEAVRNFQSAQKDWPHWSKRQVVSGRRRMGMEDGIEEYTYCLRCNGYRPAGAGHCMVCDICIKGWDHHCPVFGGCVGEKNIIAFGVMVFCLPAFWIFLLICGVIHFGGSWSEAKIYENLTLISALIGWGCSPIVVCLCHTPCFQRCDNIHRRSPNRVRSIFELPFSKSTYPKNLTQELPVVRRTRDIRDDENNENNTEVDAVTVIT